MTDPAPHNNPAHLGPPPQVDGPDDGAWRIAAYGCFFVIIAGIVLVLVPIIYNLYYWPWAFRRGGPIVQRSAAPIIAGIEAYHSDHGAFPPRLESLRPEYLEKIPPPGWGWNGWDYSVSRGGNVFYLSVYYGRSYEAYHYDGRATGGEWGVDE